MIRHLASVITVALGCVLITISCTSTRKTTSDVSATPATVETQLANGAPIYTQTCATSACHGTQGKGIKSGNGFKVWPLVGDEFQSRHPNAQVVFDIIRSGDEPNLRALTDQQIYDAIAYELSQNQITLKSPLTVNNAFTTYGGSMSGKAQGGLFPPSDNSLISKIPRTRDLPIATKNNKLRLQVDQLAEASAIANTKPPESGAFMILVIMFNDLDSQPITISPDHLSLSTSSSELLQPQLVGIHSPSRNFIHKQSSLSMEPWRWSFLC